MIGQGFISAPTLATAGVAAAPMATARNQMLLPSGASIPSRRLLSGRADVNGFIGGGQLGYNWQRGTWVFGLEGDIQFSNERGSGDVCTVAGCPAGSAVFTRDYKLDWFGTARGRVGFLPAERILLYATGGLAYGGFSGSSSTLTAGHRHLVFDKGRLDRWRGRGGGAWQQLVGQVRISLHGSRATSVAVPQHITLRLPRARLNLRPPRSHTYSIRNLPTTSCEWA